MIIDSINDHLYNKLVSLLLLLSFFEMSQRTDERKRRVVCGMVMVVSSLKHSNSSDYNDNNYKLLNMKY